jgi:capsular polysaccharide biosynthesis protein
MPPLAEALPSRVSKMDTSTNDVTAMVWQKALVPETPVSPPPVRTAAAAAALGTLVGIGLAFLFEYLDNGAGKRDVVAFAFGIIRSSSDG